jgi:hypothetical protein
MNLNLQLTLEHQDVSGSKRILQVAKHEERNS